MSISTSLFRNPSQFAPFAAVIVFLTILAWPVLRFWWWEYTSPDAFYQHGPIVPIIIGFMLWHKRDSLRESIVGERNAASGSAIACERKGVPTRLAIACERKGVLTRLAIACERKGVPTLLAIAAVLLCTGLLLFALKNELEAVESAALILLIWASVWMVFGGRFVKAAAFPLAFIVCMAPLPGPLLRDATFGLQNLSTSGANFILNHLSFDTVRAGNAITMENFSFTVDVPCSGFKMLLSMATFSAAFAYLVDGKPWKRTLLFLLSLPLSLLVNSMRVALIGIVGECMGTGSAHLFHDYSGIITLTFGFIVLFSLAKALGCRKFAEWPIF